ncbi:hypothetical protein Tco_0213340 [Tanacetum coccineum]
MENSDKAEMEGKGRRNVEEDDVYKDDFDMAECLNMNDMMGLDKGVKSGNTSGVLKKLDRIMGNEEFIDKFPHAHAVFLPNLIFDHSPNVMIFPNSLHTKKRAFKFSNFVADKKEFNPTVMNIWNGVYEDQLKEIQINIDKRPDSKQIREKESRILSEYVEAMKVEEKLLFQKAKIKWLCLGDRNNSYFHKVLKSRNILLLLTHVLQIVQHNK